MRQKKGRSSDFRYNTGAAKVPWAAVGESITVEEVDKIVRFLMPCAAEDTSLYEQAASTLRKALTDLKAQSQYAGKLTLGGQVQALEKSVCRLLEAPYAAFLTNATAGFEIAAKYAGLKKGDELIAPPITFISTILYALEVGAKVVFADVDPVTLNMDPADVARKITPRTKVIMPVHLGGYPVDMDPIMKLARAHGITVIEDAAHAFGGSYKGRMLGSIGHFGAFSFHEVKNVHAFGEGGILATQLPFGKAFAQARFVGLNPRKRIRHWLYDVTALKGKEGWFAPSNHSATEIQALVLLSQMHRLKDIIASRRRHAVYLTRRFSKVPNLIPQRLDTKDTRATYHLYLLQLDPSGLKGDVQTLKRKLTEKGIVQIAHFAPLYKFSIMKQMGYDRRKLEATCPVAEEAFRHRFTHLPLYPLSDAQVEYMADKVIEAVDDMRR